MPVRWSIVGVGRAGAARARAIQRDDDSVLASVYRGRGAEETGAPVVHSLQEAIAAADAVAICSPTEHHAEQVRAVLQAGRHCVVEFPVASDEPTGRRLLALAGKHGRILHIEHIELLSAPARVLRGNVRPVSVRRAHIAFHGRGPADAPGATLAHRNVARLHRLVDVAGPVHEVLEVQQAPGRLRARLLLSSGAQASASFEQSPYYGRLTRLEIQDHEETWLQENQSLKRGRVPQTLLEPAPLFESDHAWMMQRILQGEVSYVSDDRILHVLRLADRLQDGSRGSLGGI